VTTLVVQAHPLEQSYNSALLDAVVAQAPGARVVRLGQGDRWTPYACIDATRLVAVYPTWWGSLPAMLLDALNDLIGPWVDGDQSRDTSPLRTIESLTVLTSHGSPKRINMLQGEPGLQLWKRTIVPLCAPGARFSWQSLYKIDRASPAERNAFVDSLTIT
jgi:putative NADPH-quinone reductase